MTDNATDLALASDFPPVTHEQWLDVAASSLRGRSLADLSTKTLDGIQIDALYNRSTVAADSLGQFPFTRAVGSAGNSLNGWEIRQSYSHPDPATCNQQVLDELNRGVTAVHLSLSPAACSLNPLTATTPFTGNGIEIYSLEDLAATLDGVYLDLATVSFSSGAAFAQTADMMQSLWSRNSLTAEQCLARFNADPIGTLAKTGTLPYSIHEGLVKAAELAKQTGAHYPKSTSIAVNGAIYHDNGASEAQELALMLATGKAYLQAMLERGIGVNHACKQIEVQLATDTDYFLSAAKLRAARTLWASMTQACGATDDAQAIRLCARTSRRMLTVADPWVNILRTTVAASAAAIGGAGSIMVDAFDSASGSAHGSNSGRRIARNILVTLMEESNLHKVADPMGGSGYIEHLTAELCEKAWVCFQTLEKAGGIVNSLNKNTVQDMINSTHQQRDQLIQHGTLPIVGVSEFPLLDEAPVDVDPQLAVLAANARAAALAATSNSPDTSTDRNESNLETVTAMPVRRLAEPFESIRSVLDGIAIATGTRPSVFVAAIGEPADYIPRVQFARNLLAAGGIGATIPDGTVNAESMITNFRNSGSSVAVVCVSAKTDEAVSTELVKSLHNAGADFVLFAGRPSEGDSQLKQSGVDLFIYRGCNLVVALADTAKALGVQM